MRWTLATRYDTYQGSRAYLDQVIDDGCHTDARMAFERHATSKIREAADLFSLTTMDQ